MLAFLREDTESKNNLMGVLFLPYASQNDKIWPYIHFNYKCIFLYDITYGVYLYHSSRALVDILRHQSVAGSHGERNNSTTVTLGQHDNGPSRPPKNLYNPVKSAKNNHGK